MKKSIFKLFREFLEAQRLEEEVRKAREHFVNNPTEAILRELIAQAEVGVEATIKMANGASITVRRTQKGLETVSGGYKIEGDF